jgi:hypothetical protein
MVSFQCSRYSGLQYKVKELRFSRRRRFKSRGLLGCVVLRQDSNVSEHYDASIFRGDLGPYRVFIFHHPVRRIVTTMQFPAPMGTKGSLLCSKGLDIGLYAEPVGSSHICPRSVLILSSHTRPSSQSVFPTKNCVQLKHLLVSSCQPQES